MEISKTFRWEMGHRLPEHPGGCRNLHGHSYRLEVSIRGEVAANGMVIDFDDVTRAVRPLIEELDHAFLCDTSDGALLQFLRDQDLKHVVVAFPSTVENICRLIAERLRPLFAGRANIRAFTLCVHETETSAARLTVETHAP